MLLEQAKQLSWDISIRSTTDFYAARSQANLLLQGSRSSKDPVVSDYLQNIFRQDLLGNGVNRSANLHEFVDSMQSWLQQHSTNKIIGLNRFQADFSAGTTQAFDSFYYQHRHRRMRCFVGEYFYHLKTWISTNTAWSFITDEDPLVHNDAVIISWPFCDTGNEYSGVNEVLAHCEQLGIPVLIDCCYYTISSNVLIDLTSPAINTVAFSLSKAFPIANLRIGVRYTRPGTYDGQRLHHSINYNNTLSAKIGLDLINRFESDYIYRTYHSKQQEVCNYFALTPSNSVLFAIGDSEWSCYNRNNLLQSYGLQLDPDQFHNRINLVSIFDNWDLFENIKNEHKS
jgi:hypothetical protein